MRSVGASSSHVTKGGSRRISQRTVCRTCSSGAVRAASAPWTTTSSPCSARALLASPGRAPARRPSQPLLEKSFSQRSPDPKTAACAFPRPALRPGQSVHDQRLLRDETFAAVFRCAQLRHLMLSPGSELMPSTSPALTIAATRLRELRMDSLHGGHGGIQAPRCGLRCVEMNVSASYRPPCRP